MNLRGRRPGLFAQARISQGALYLLGLELGFSLVYLFVDPAGQALFARYLLASPQTLWHELKVWTLVTSTFVQPGFVALLFHGFILWMFVPAIERWWGTRRFLVFALVTSAVAALIGTLAATYLVDPVHYSSYVISGLDAFIFASIVAYGVIFASSQVQFWGVLPMTGKQLAFGICGFAALMIVFSRDWARGAGWAAAMAVGYCMASGRLNPRLWWLRYQQRRLRRHLRVVPDDRDNKRRWMN
jgi:membrane associated rhomboid family serine protease